MAERSFRFTDAIVRRPGPNVVCGLRAHDAGDPDPRAFAEEHAAYVAALRRAGLQVTELDPDPAHADSVFVEDPALCLREGAVLLHPGAPSRQGEVAATAPTLTAFFLDVQSIGEAGFVDGGDILVTEREVIVGLSERTDMAGFEALDEILWHWGYKTRIVETPADILHFKTACSLLDGNTVLATETMAESGLFDDYAIVLVPDGEEPAANAIRVNDVVLMSNGFPNTVEAVRAAGFDVETIATSQAALLDGGLSCMSLRFWRG